MSITLAADSKRGIPFFPINDQLKRYGRPTLSSHQRHDEISHFPPLKMIRLRIPGYPDNVKYLQSCPLQKQLISNKSTTNSICSSFSNNSKRPAIVALKPKPLTSRAGKQAPKKAALKKHGVSNEALYGGKYSLGSLYLHCKKFVNLLRAAPSGILDIKVAVEALGMPKRRIYDITNVLEGISVIQKISRNQVQWIGAGPSNSSREVQNLCHELQKLQDEEQKLDKLISVSRTSLLHMSREEADRDLAYVRCEDFQFFARASDDKLIIIRSPGKTRVNIWEPAHPAPLATLCKQEQMFPCSQQSRKCSLKLTSPAEQIHAFYIDAENNLQSFAKLASDEVAFALDETVSSQLNFLPQELDDCSQSSFNFPLEFSENQTEDGTATFLCNSEGIRGSMSEPGSICSHSIEEQSSLTSPPFSDSNPSTSITSLLHYDNSESLTPFTPTSGHLNDAFALRKSFPENPDSSIDNFIAPLSFATDIEPLKTHPSDNGSFYYNSINSHNVQQLFPNGNSCIPDLSLFTDNSSLPGYLFDEYLPDWLRSDQARVPGVDSTQVPINDMYMYNTPDFGHYSQDSEVNCDIFQNSSTINQSPFEASSGLYDSGYESMLATPGPTNGPSLNYGHFHLDSLTPARQNLHDVLASHHHSSATLF